MQGTKLSTAALRTWLSQAPWVSVGQLHTHTSWPALSPAMLSRPGRARPLAPHTSDLCVVRYAHDAVGVIGGGGDLSRTASAVSAAKDEGR